MKQRVGLYMGRGLPSYNHVVFSGLRWSREPQGCCGVGREQCSVLIW